MTKIFLDPGHGGQDPGATGHGLREKDIVLTISRFAREYLEANYPGVSVKMSRTDDRYVSLSQRASDANRWGADVFASIHINAAVSTANGYEDFIFNGNVSNDTHQLQNAIHNKLSPFFPTNRGKKRANFAVLRQTNMPAVLTESGFITNKRDADFLRKTSNLKKLGQAHAKGIADFLGLDKKASVNKKEVKYMDPSSPALRKDFEEKLIRAVRRGIIDNSHVEQYKNGTLEQSNAIALTMLILSQEPSTQVYDAHKEAWEKAEQKGIMNGERPNHPLTRSEFATVANRVGLLD